MNVVVCGINGFHRLQHGAMGKNGSISRVRAVMCINTRHSPRKILESLDIEKCSSTALKGGIGKTRTSECLQMESMDAL